MLPVTFREDIRFDSDCFDFDVQVENNVLILPEEFRDFCNSNKISDAEHLICYIWTWPVSGLAEAFDTGLKEVGAALDKLTDVLYGHINPAFLVKAAAQNMDINKLWSLRASLLNSPAPQITP